MGKTQQQTWQLVNEFPLNILESKNRESLDNILNILDSKINFPFSISLDNFVVNIGGSTITTSKSGSNGPEESYKISSHPILGNYKNVLSSSLDLTNGTTTGDFELDQNLTCPVMLPNYYVWMGVELRSNGKHYLIWGDQSEIESDATYPLFTNGDAVLQILLKDDSSGGRWNFNQPSTKDVILFKESNALELREDTLPKVKVIDIVSTSLPTGTGFLIDSTSISEFDLVLFTKPEIEGLYRALNVDTGVVWQKILQPNNGANVQVTDGTSYFRTIWKRINGFWSPLEVADAVREPSGFPNRTDSTFSFNNVTKTFTIQPVGTHFDYFIKGSVYRVIEPKSITISDTKGSHFIFFDGANLTEQSVFDDTILSSKAYVSYVYLNDAQDAAIIVADERHGITMDGATHKYLHLSVGTVLQSGLSVGSFTIEGDGTSDDDAKLSLSDARLFDEDIDVTITNSASPSSFFEQKLNPIAYIPIYYKNGTQGHWLKDSATEFPLKTGTSRLKWNQFSGGSWTTSDVANDDHFTTTWIFASNATNEPIIGILGQYTYSSLSEAQEKEQYAALNLTNFPVIEFKLCYRLIWQTSSAYTNGAKAKLVDIQDLRISPDAPFPSVSTNDHGLLSGLQDPDHAPTAVTTQGVVKDGGLSESDIDASNVFDTFNKLFGQLRLKSNTAVSSDKKRVNLTGSNRTLNNSTEVGQALGLLLLKFDGAQIDFAQGKVFDLDGNDLNNNFVMPTTPLNNYRWYSVTLVPSGTNLDNTLSVSVSVSAATLSDPSKELAPKAGFGDGLKVGQVLVRKSSTNVYDIAQSDIIQLGVGSGSGDGGGTGDANELLERLKSRLDSSDYEYMTPAIFSIIGATESKIPETTAEYSSINKNFKFQSGSIYQSISVLDSDFLSQDASDAVDVDEVEVVAYYDLDYIDTNPTFQLSRDKGFNFQNIAMTRIGNSDTYIGRYTFTTENTFQFNQQIGTATTGQLIFTDSPTSFFARSFSLLETTTIKRITAAITSSGAPVGKIYAKVVKSSGGNPSTDPNDLLGYSSPISINALNSGVNTVNFEITCVLPFSENFHVIIETDNDYKAYYSLNNANRISIARDTSSQAIFTLRGRQLGLILKITGGTNDSLFKGYGILYRISKVVKSADDGYQEFKVVFNGFSDNLNEFLLPFTPDRRILNVYELGTGQIYKFGAFSIEGNKIIFPQNTFKKPEIVSLLFEQISNIEFKLPLQSDKSYSLLVENNLGSANSQLDLSTPGRGIYLRRPDGVLREITIDNDDNITIYSV
jgi:hypothetical protein